MDMSVGISVVTPVLSELAAVPPPPVVTITNPQFDDATDTATAEISEAGTAMWATYREVDGQPSPQADLTWDGTTRETGSEATGDDRDISLNFTLTDPTADRLIYTIVSAAEAIADPVIHPITFAGAGGFAYSATTHGLIVTYAGTLTMTPTTYGIIFSDGGTTLGSIQLGPDTYDVEANGAASQVTVPQLTAGAISGADLEVGDTLSVTGSNASDRAEYQWQRDGSDIFEATAATYDTTGQVAGDYRRGVSDGVQGPVYTAAVTVSAVAPPAGADVATHMGEQARETAVTNTPSTSIDVSGQQAGDTLVFILGGAFGGSDPSAATVNGKAATRLRQWSGGSGNRGGLFTYDLDAADITAGTIDVVGTVGTGGQNSVFDFVITESGSVVDHQQATNSTSLSVTTTDAENTIFAFVHGVDERFSGDGPVFSGVMPARIYTPLAVNNQGCAASIRQDAPVGANTIQFTIDGSNNYSVVGVVIE